MTLIGRQVEFLIVNALEKDKPKSKLQVFERCHRLID